VLRKLREKVPALTMGTIGGLAYIAFRLFVTKEITAVDIVGALVGGPLIAGGGTHALVDSPETVTRKVAEGATLAVKEVDAQEAGPPGQVTEAARPVIGRVTNVVVGKPVSAADRIIANVLAKVGR
jgi:hypothetical protein